jgi:hypothetical protein
MKVCKNAKNAEQSKQAANARAVSHIKDQFPESQAIQSLLHMHAITIISSHHPRLAKAVDSRRPKSLQETSNTAKSKPSKLN